MTVRDDRLKTTWHPYNRDTGAARDTGIDAATGVWVTFLEDDDEWLPGRLAA